MMCAEPQAFPVLSSGVGSNQQPCFIRNISKQRTRISRIVSRGVRSFEPGSDVVRSSASLQDVTMVFIYDFPDDSRC